MANALEKEKHKLVQERCQFILSTLLKDEDNKYCVDCDAKSPRWASWNIGIFLCIRCAGIHRNLGVHISKVKSVNLDSWTPQQVASIEQMGNSRARAIYEANLPDSFRRPHSDPSLEQFIRAKYEAKKYVAKEWVPSPLPNPTWDAEIERQLRKKKEKKSVGKIELPSSTKMTTKSNNISPKPLPKAPVKLGSPRLESTKRNSPSTKKSDSLSSKGTALDDLLGLDSSKPVSNGKDSDTFGDFLSAPISCESNSTANTTDPVQSSEEANFFNQVKSDPNTSEKLSKDSILALYAKTPAPQQQNTMFGNAYGVDPMAVPGFQNNIPMQGAVGVNQTMLPGQGSMIPPQANPAFAVNHSQYPTAQVPLVPQGFALSSANPFAQVQSQFGGMNIGGNMAGPFGPQGSQLPQGSTNQQIGMNASSNTLPNNFWQ